MPTVSLYFVFARMSKTIKTLSFWMKLELESLSRIPKGNTVQQEALLKRKKLGPNQVVSILCVLRTGLTTWVQSKGLESMF